MGEVLTRGGLELRVESRSVAHHLKAEERMYRRASIIILLALLFGVVGGCGREPESKGPQFATKPLSLKVPIYNLAVYALHNPAKLFQAYQPLVDYLNNRLEGVHLHLEASRDYADFEEKVRAGRPEIILPNPWQTLQAMKAGYHVIAMAGDPEDLKGLIVVRRDSTILRPADLKGQAVSYPSPTAMAACIMPQYFLHTHGINVNKDIKNRFVGSQESSIMNVYLGKTVAGATRPMPWRAFKKEHPREASELKVIWQTESLVNNSVMVRGDIPPRIREQVRKLLIGLDGSREGKAILDGMETSRFLPASDGTYDVVRQYIARFEREVRPVEQLE